MLIVRNEARRLLKVLLLAERPDRIEFEKENVTPERKREK